MFFAINFEIIIAKIKERVPDRQIVRSIIFIVEIVNVGNKLFIATAAPVLVFPIA